MPPMMVLHILFCPIQMVYHDENTCVGVVHEVALVDPGTQSAQGRWRERRDRLDRDGD